MCASCQLSFLGAPRKQLLPHIIHTNALKKQKKTSTADEYTRWFKYDRDKLLLVYTQIVPIIFEPPCNTDSVNKQTNKQTSRCLHAEAHKRTLYLLRVHMHARAACPRVRTHARTHTHVRTLTLTLTV